MHRIDHPTATPGELFTESDPTSGTPATVVTDDWLNAVQEELASYIESRGIALNKADNGQLEEAIAGHVRSEVTGGFRNLLINPDFRFWQRVDPVAGGPFALPTTDIDVFDVDFVDRWYATAGGGGAGTIDRQAFTPGQTAVPFEPQWFLEWDQTTAATTSDPALIQAIEDVRTAAGQTLTVSFEARVTSGTLDVDVDVLQVFGPGGSADVATASSTGTLTLTTTWTKFAFVVPVASIAGKTVGSQHHYLAARIRLPQSETFTMQITHVQAEVGNGASDFERRGEADELRLCQRYYEKSLGNLDLPPANGSAPQSTFVVNYDGGSENSTAYISGIAFKTPKRHFGTGSGGPFVVFYSAGSATLVDLFSGATSEPNRIIDTIEIDANGVITGEWGVNVPAAAGVYLASAVWACDVEFGTE